VEQNTVSLCAVCAFFCGGLRSELPICPSIKHDFQLGAKSLPFNHVGDSINEERRVPLSTLNVSFFLFFASCVLYFVTKLRAATNRAPTRGQSITDIRHKFLDFNSQLQLLIVIDCYELVVDYLSFIFFLRIHDDFYGLLLTLSVLIDHSSQ